MPITVVCEGCSQKYRLPDERAGSTIRCKECGERIEVPDGDDDDFDARPARRTGGRKKKKSSGPSVGLIIGLVGGAAFLLFALIGVGVFLAVRSSRPVPVANQPLPAGGAPIGAAPGDAVTSPVATVAPAEVVWSVVADPPQNPIAWPAAPPKLDGFRGQLSQLKFSSARSPFVVTGTTGSGDLMRIWNLATGEAVGQFDRPKPQFSGTKTALSADGQWIVVVLAGKQEAEIWSVREGKLNKTVPTGKAGSTVNYVDVISPDKLIVVDQAQSVHRLAVLDIVSGNLLHEATLPEGIYYDKVAMSPGLRYLAIDHGYKEGLRFYDVARGGVVGRVPPGEYCDPGGGSSGLRFSHDGSKLGVLGSNSTKTFVAVVDLATGKATRAASMPGTITSAVPSYSYSNAPQLQWLDDGQGWLLGGNVILDAASNAAVWRVQTEANEYQLENGRARIPVGSGLWSVDGPDSDGVLTQIEIPWEKIHGLLAKINDESNLVKAGAPAGVVVDVGMLRFAEAEPTKQELAKSMTARLAALGLTAGDNAPVVFRAAYSEAPGNTMDFSGLGQITARKSVQSTKTTLELKLTDATGATVYWSHKDEHNPFSLIMRGDPTPELVRKECFNQVLQRLNSLVLPTYLDVTGSEQLPVLHPMPRW